MLKTSKMGLIGGLLQEVGWFLWQAVEHREEHEEERLWEPSCFMLLCGFGVRVNKLPYRKGLKRLGMVLVLLKQGKQASDLHSFR